VIPLAAAFAAQTHGDARKAIDLMRVAGELAEREGDARVCEGHVRAAQAKVEKNRVLEVVRGISTQRNFVCTQQRRSLHKRLTGRLGVRLGTECIST